MYISVKMKFVLCTLLALSWMILSIFIALPWIGELSMYIGNILSWIVISGIAIIPGFMNAFLLSGLLFDKRPKFDKCLKLEPISILIACYNESANIVDTIKSIYDQNYECDFEVIVIDDGSTDNTAELVRKMSYTKLKLIELKQNHGKSYALNEGLKHVTYDLTITIDGDSYLYKEALSNLVLRYKNDPDNTVAVAGAVLVRNSRLNFITKIQEWDYFHGIASIKRLQSLCQGTLVAQGAFSLYETQALKDNGGWSDTVGEDIVLTWELLNKGYRVGFAENACLFTNTPTTLKQLFKQRERWARGMIEAFKGNYSLLFKLRYITLFIWWNLMFPYLDLIYTFVFIPGIILALFGYYMIAGPMTLIVLPLGLLVNYVMYRNQIKMFKEQGLKVRKNPLGFITYVLFYGLILQPASLLGYAKEIIGIKKYWGTK